MEDSDTSLQGFADFVKSRLNLVVATNLPPLICIYQDSLSTRLVAMKPLVLMIANELVVLNRTVW